MSERDEKELKAAFALELIKQPGNPFAAACTVFGTDIGRALYAANHWIGDEFVLEEKKRLVEDEGDDAFLPTKADTLRAIWNVANDTHVEAKDKIAAFKLYAEVRNFIEKPQTNITANLVTNKVMVVKEFESTDEWERKLINQQAKLTNASANC